jgi:hypothetical protein
MFDLTLILNADSGSRLNRERPIRRSAPASDEDEAGVGDPSLTTATLSAFTACTLEAGVIASSAVSEVSDDVDFFKYCFSLWVRTVEKSCLAGPWCNRSQAFQYGCCVARLSRTGLESVRVAINAMWDIILQTACGALFTAADHIVRIALPAVVKHESAVGIVAAMFADRPDQHIKSAAEATDSSERRVLAEALRGGFRRLFDSPTVKWFSKMCSASRRMGPSVTAMSMIQEAEPEQCVGKPRTYRSSCFNEAAVVANQLIIAEGLSTSCLQPADVDMKDPEGFVSQPPPRTAAAATPRSAAPNPSGSRPARPPPTKDVAMDTTPATSDRKVRDPPDPESPGRRTLSGQGRDRSHQRALFRVGAPQSEGPSRGPAVKGPSMGEAAPQEGPEDHWRSAHALVPEPVNAQKLDSGSPLDHYLNQYVTVNPGYAQFVRFIRTCPVPTMECRNKSAEHQATCRLRRAMTAEGSQPAQVPQSEGPSRGPVPQVPPVPQVFATGAVIAGSRYLSTQYNANWTAQTLCATSIPILRNPSLATPLPSVPSIPQYYTAPTPHQSGGAPATGAMPPLVAYAAPAAAAAPPVTGFVHGTHQPLHDQRVLDLPPPEAPQSEGPSRGLAGGRSAPDRDLDLRWMPDTPQPAAEAGHLSSSVEDLDVANHENEIAICLALLPVRGKPNWRSSTTSATVAQSVLYSH